jgi:hypothetical protein
MSHFSSHSQRDHIVPRYADRDRRYGYMQQSSYILPSKFSPVIASILRKKSAN